MTTIIPHSELLRRALVYISEEKSQSPSIPLSKLLDDASMRFNLSPLDTEALMRLLTTESPTIDSK